MSPRSGCSHDASCWRRSGRRGSHVAPTGAPAELGTWSVVRSDGMGREHGDGALGRGQLLNQSRGRRKESPAVGGVVLSPRGPRRGQPAAVAKGAGGGSRGNPPPGGRVLYGCARPASQRVGSGRKHSGQGAGAPGPASSTGRLAVRGRLSSVCPGVHRARRVEGHSSATVLPSVEL